jgi:acyl-CoA reductase-like NAD-dependent aldehyde dehydrogenase
MSDSFASYEFESPVATPPPTAGDALDAAVDRLCAAAVRFATLSIPDRIALARSMQEGYARIAERSVAVACEAKGIPFDSSLAGEEWLSGPWPVIRHLRLIRESLEQIQATGTTRVVRPGRCADDRLRVRVCPENTLDSVLFPGVSVDVHMLDGVTEEGLASARASFYKEPQHQGRVVLVLGAGNVASIAPTDVITKMFNEGMVCLLKMNPVNAYMGPFIERAFAAAIEQGFLVVAYGGVEEGAYLTRHEGIDEIHITGSDKTHDAIVWGSPGPDRDERIVADRPLLDKEITSELGNISPVIVVPGPLTDRQLRFQAEDVAAAMTVNASFLCIAAKMLVMPKGWEGREPFLRELERVLTEVPARRAYYPGAHERWHTLTAGRDSIQCVGDAGTRELPWALITDLDPENAADPLFQTESFCSIISEVAVGGAEPISFLEAAVDFVNNRLWGTLAATLIVPHSVARDSVTAQAVERAIAKLRYGTVGVNIPPAAAFTLGTPPWGGYPGSSRTDIQSGRGWVHNARMLEGIEKVVIRSPLTRFPKPVYFPSHRQASGAGRRLVALDMNGSWARVPGLVLAALRG